MWGLFTSACIKLSLLLCAIAPGRGLVMATRHPSSCWGGCPVYYLLAVIIQAVSQVTDCGQRAEAFLSPITSPLSLPSLLLTPCELFCLLLTSVRCGTDLDQTYQRNLGLHGCLFDLFDFLTGGPFCLRPTSCREPFRIVLGPLLEHKGGRGKLFNHQQCDVEIRGEAGSKAEGAWECADILWCSK